VPPWILVRLKPMNYHDVRDIVQECNQEIKFGLGGEKIANDLVVGDNEQYVKALVMKAFGYCYVTSLFTM
jgi:hypothetical protein